MAKSYILKRRVKKLCITGRAVTPSDELPGNGKHSGVMGPNDSKVF